MKDILLIIPVFVFGCAWMFVLTLFAPVLDIHEEYMPSFPTTIEDLQNTSYIMSRYFERHKVYVVILFGSAYIFKQTFCIPGSAMLNVIAGALFGFWAGLPLVCFFSTIGGLACYTLSKYCLMSVIKKRWGVQVNNLEKQIEDAKHQIFYYLLSLRLFPVTPNWLINLMSPLVGISPKLYGLTLFLGLIPYNACCVQAGSLLKDIKSMDEVFTPTAAFKLTMLAVTALAPGLVLKYRGL